MEEGGDISQLQVDQFEQQLLGGRTKLLTDQLQYLQSLDQFKLQLGLPTPLPIELDDTAVPSPEPEVSALRGSFQTIRRRQSRALCDSSAGCGGQGARRVPPDLHLLAHCPGNAIPRDDPNELAGVGKAVRAMNSPNGLPIIGEERASDSGKAGRSGNERPDAERGRSAAAKHAEFRDRPGRLRNGASRIRKPALAERA